MLYELCMEIVSCQLENDQIILLIDANEYVGDPYMTTRLVIIGPKEAILDRHNQAWGRQPKYYRGQDPINRIFVSAHHQVQAAGYLPFGEAPSDHRGIWVKVKEEEVFGYSMEKVVPLATQRLTVDNPRVVKRCIGLYKKFILKHNLSQRVFFIQSQIQIGNWNATVAAEYEDIHF